MLGIDFPELVVIAVVALIVIGPEHLPKVARTMGHLWGRAQRYINTVKADISRDMAVDELRKLQKEAQQGVSDFKVSMNRASQELSEQMNDIQNDISGSPKSSGTSVTADAMDASNALGSKYELGKSIPPNELATEVLSRSELLKSEMPKQDVTKTELPRHEIIEEHHAVMPASLEPKKSSEA
jgi:sec-independent protein translocase protein TatB